MCIFEESISMMKNKTGLGVVLGAIIGAGLTWLFTSKEGKELVAKTKEKASELADEISKRLASAPHKKSEDNG
ncbi:MAG: YtxH domain-containing protein [Bacteroidota bacterium]